MLVGLPVLVVLLALGTWQVRRLAWKTELLDRIAAIEAGPAVPLDDAATRAQPALFQKVRVTGRLDHAREALLGLEVRGSTLGAHLLTPLLSPEGAPLLVDRGWVPLERTAPVARPEGEVAVIGWIRPAEPRDSMAARDDPAGRRFYSWDPAAIGAAIGLPDIAGFGLVALAPAGADARALPAPTSRLPRPNNPHLGYAITWFGLAFALLGVVVVFAARRLREPA